MLHRQILRLFLDNLLILDELENGSDPAESREKYEKIERGTELSSIFLSLHLPFIWMSRQSEIHYTFFHRFRVKTRTQQAFRSIPNGEKKKNEHTKKDEIVSSIFCAQPNGSKFN